MTLRIIGRGEGELTRGYPGGGEDGYTSRLVKLVPAEAVGVYPLFSSQAETLSQTFKQVGATFPDRLPVYIVAWVILLIVVILRWNATREPGKGAQWGAVLIAAVAFVIWVHVLKGDFGFELLFPKADPTRASPVDMVGEKLKEFVSSLALMAWTLLAPVVYRGEGEEA